MTIERRTRIFKHHDMVLTLELIKKLSMPDDHRHI